MPNPRLLFRNANIITLNDRLPTVDSVMIEGSKILHVGKNLEPAPGTRVFDLEGATIVPGLTDAHVHLANFGRFLEELQLVGLPSEQQVANLVEEATRQIPAGQWILGRGWDQNRWPDGFPQAEILNQIAPDHPVLLIRIDGHAGWVNKAAWHHAGLDPQQEIDGGRVINQCVLLDNALDPFLKIVPSPSDDDIRRYLISGSRTFAERGLTAVHDVWQDRRIIRILQELIKEDKIPLRIYGMLAYNDPELLAQYFSAGPFQTPQYVLRGVKAFIDGALGSRGAALLEPYEGEPGNIGFLVTAPEELTDLARRCMSAGFQLNTHAIGDRAVRTVLDIYEKVLGDNRNHRWRIEHVQVLHDDDLPRFARLGILPSMQPSHYTSDMPWLSTRLGSHRTDRISRIASLIRSGIKVPGGSDCPIETGDPILEYYAAVSRQEINGHPQGGWNPKERVEPLDALRMLTSWAAYSGFQEHTRGQIKPGFDADLTVLNTDITAVPFAEIPKTKVVMTVMNGRITYLNTRI